MNEAARTNPSARLAVVLLLSACSPLDTQQDDAGNRWFGSSWRSSSAERSTTDTSEVPDLAEIWSIEGTTYYEELGSEVASAGDVDGDGDGELILGLPDDNQALIFLGDPESLSSTPDLILDGASIGGEFASAVSGAGDVDGDGYDDVVISAPSASVGGLANVGAVYLFRGGSGGLSTVAELALTGSEAEEGFGARLASIGDINGDGYGDIAVASPGYSSPYTEALGKFWVFLGGPTGLTATPALTVVGVTEYAFLGHSIAGAGDVNGDGFDDLIVGEQGCDCDFSTSTSWIPAYVNSSAYLYLGSATGPAASPSLTLSGDHAITPFFAYSIAGGGDINADGYADLVIGNALECTHDGWGWGSDYDSGVSIYFGGPSGPSTTADHKISMSGWAAGCLGESVAVVSDLDGDGSDELALGTYSSKVTYLFFGGTSEVSASPDIAVLASSSYTKPVGWHDAMGPGLDALAVSEPWATSSKSVRLAGRLGIQVVTEAIDSDGDGWTTSTDCDDTDATIHPGAEELCDTANLDEDCDGLADDGDPSASTGTMATFYLDGDADGYGAHSFAACDLPAGAVTDSTDCDDTDATIHPGAEELCDAADIDEDCDGLADDSDPSASTGTMATFYLDGDADGYGAHPIAACDLPAGAVADSTDCDDTDATIHPGAVELCDPADLDEDCDGLADDGDPSASTDTMATFYLDGDADGYGADPVAACDLPAGAVADSTDCDDTNAAVHPDAEERCDAADLDEDCDGLADDGDPSASTATMVTFYLDGDADSYGAEPVAACDLPMGAVADSTDCDDTNPTVHPGAEERCDDADLDEDCDGVAAHPCQTKEVGDKSGCNTGGGDNRVPLAGLNLLAAVVLHSRRRRGAPLGESSSAKAQAETAPTIYTQQPAKVAT